MITIINIIKINSKPITMKKKSSFVTMILLAVMMPAIVIMVFACSGGGIPSRPEGPCDIYTASGYPCMTAHSTTRALYASYNGPLYQVMRQSDSKTLDIGVVLPGKGDPGGYADANAQDAFCADDLCWITVIYDQSGNGNHLVQAPPGTFIGPAKGGFNTLPIADMAPVTIMGHKAYGVYIIPGMGLRNNNAVGLAINDEPQGIYMVCDGKHFDSGCCFNYGNTSTNSRAVGRGTMETVYFGTATAWGSGSGTGPWIMSDMEAGLFSGYDAKINAANPTIDSWKFVTGMVSGGGGNQWEIHGADAQGGELATLYKGIRPHSLDNDWYYPMHRKGGVQMGNGGDNGNGSAGTFYEGVMITGYPDEETLKTVQNNIVAAKYDVQRISLSRVTTFTPGSAQEVTGTFTNTTGAAVSGLKMSIAVPDGWTALVSGTENPSMAFSKRIAPGESVSANFKLTAGSATGAGFMTCKAEWKDQFAIISQRLRSAYPVKINEIRFDGGSANPTDQFVELFNAGDADIDISGWTLINTRSEWAPVKLGTIPGGTIIKTKGFYLLGLAGSGLAAPANRGEKIINVLSTDGFIPGQQIEVDGEKNTIANIGTAASPMALVFVPVSTGPWLTIPAGSTNLPVTDAAGFVVGQKIGIDMGGNYEVATVTSAGKASTLTTLAAEAKTGDMVIKVAANSNMTAGDILTIGTGASKETAVVKRLINIAAAPVRGGFDMGFGGSRVGEVELTEALKFDHMLAEDVSDKGTGISFTPATRFDHKSGDAVQALGSGITLRNTLESDHEAGAAVINPMAKSSGYQGSVKPDKWYGFPLSSSAGSVSLMDASGVLVVDAIVYGSRQSNSSANGTVTSPEIATLEGDQGQGGCMVIAPGAGRNTGPFVPPSGNNNKSVGRFPDGTDTDSNCSDFLLQNTTTLSAGSANGANNIKTASVADFVIGQEITIGTDRNSEKAVIAEIGTAGATTVGTAIAAGATSIPVAGSEGFNAGQTITINTGAKMETAVISSTAAGRRRFGGGAMIMPMDTIKVTAALKNAHASGSQVSGSGITLAKPLSFAHERGSQVAGSMPTPGEPNQYTRKP